MYKKPQVIFEVKSLADTINIMTSFFEDDSTIEGRFATALAKNFNIDISTLKGKSKLGKMKVVKECITPIYNDNLLAMQEKVKELEDYWNQNSNLVCTELEKIFRIKFQGTEYYTAYVNINKICPRYLNDQSFDVNFRNSKEDVLSTCIHELIHFYWFMIWKENYPECPTENFEAPHTEWLLSEIAIDPIVYFSELRNIMREKPAYNYFYDTKIWDTENLIEVFRKLYKSNTLDNFMDRGLKLLNNNPELVKELVK